MVVTVGSLRLVCVCVCVVVCPAESVSFSLLQQQVLVVSIDEVLMA